MTSTLKLANSTTATINGNKSLQKYYQRISLSATTILQISPIRQQGTLVDRGEN